MVVLSRVCEAVVILVILLFPPNPNGLKGLLGPIDKVYTVLDQMASIPV